MRKVRSVSFVALLLLAGMAPAFQAQQGPIQGCYQKNNGQVRIVQNREECKSSELAAIWAQAKSAQKKGGSRTIIPLQTLGGTVNFGYAINDRSDVVGSSFILGDGISHAFLFRQAQIFDLAPFNSGAFQTTGPTAINNHGQVTSGVIIGGVYLPAIFDTQAQTVRTLGGLGGVTPFGLSGVATSINSRGDAVGYSFLNATNRHAFLYSAGVIKDIGPGGGFNQASDINDGGVIVGNGSPSPTGLSHALLFSNGTMTDIDPFGGIGFGISESYAEAVNNRGDIVGNGLFPNVTFHAFLNRRGDVTDLGTLPGGRNSFAKGINEPGLIVGMADVPTDVCFPGQIPPCRNLKPSAFLYDNGVMLDLNDLIPGNSGWELVTAFGINDRGQIVGYGFLNGKFRAFLIS